MTDLATLQLVVDSSQVPRATAALDGLTAAGARAEAATIGVGRGSKAAAADAAAMAAAAQASARAATGMATGFRASSEALRVNTIAMRETLVVARELSRGNFTRLPGSLTLLAQGISAQGGGIKGFITSLGQTLGLVKKLQDAELAEQATMAATSAAAIENVAKRAAGNVLAADTEVALAEAQLRVVAGTDGEAAAQARLAAAHQAVVAAAGEAAVAENALAAAYADSEAAAASLAATSTVGATALGAALGLTAIAAGLLAAALGGAKDAAEQADPAAKQFTATLGLTDAQIKKLKDTSVTWGDVMHGLFNAMEKEAGTSSGQISSFFHEAFLETAQVGVSAAQVILASFAAMVKGVHSLLGSLPAIALGIVNPSLAGLAGSAIGNAGSDALAQFKQTFSGVGNFFHVTLPDSINAARDARLQAQASKFAPPKGKKSHAKQEADDTKDWLANLQSLLNKQQDLSDLLNGQTPLINRSNTAEQYLRATIGSVDAAVGKVAETFKQRQDTLMHFADEFGGAIANVVTGTESLKQAFSDLARSVIQELVQMTVKMLIFKALTSAFGKYYGTPQGSANGNVFSMGALMPFAVGGVVAGPTLFPMAGGRTGLMGEAGPEAVMPLTRDNQGRLGVRAANNNAPAVVEIHVVRGEMFEQVVGAISGNVAVKVVNAAGPEIARGAAAGVLKSIKRPKLGGHG